jgi:hypothetical protein
LDGFDRTERLKKGGWSLSKLGRVAAGRLTQG